MLFRFLRSGFRFVSLVGFEKQEKIADDI